LVLFLVVALAPALVFAAPIFPNITSNDLNFSYGPVRYTANTGILAGAGSFAVVTFDPILGGTTYPVFDLAGDFGAPLAFDAIYDHSGIQADVDVLFKSLGAGPDLTITGKIPGLGIQPGGNYTGTLLTATVSQLELWGPSGLSTLDFDGFFTVTGGDLVKAGYFASGEPLVMRSWLDGILPTLPTDSSVITAVTHEGELGAVPEPATTSLLGLGALALFGYGRRRQTKERIQRVG
jgi:hypothetical protein